MSNKKIKLSRREALIMALCSGGGLGLRSLLTGVPIHFLTRRSMAQTAGKHMIYCYSRDGDPVNSNAPGTYKTGYEHPPAYQTPENITLGSQTLQAAGVWNNLNNNIKQTANFFHLRTTAVAHNESNQALTLNGNVGPIVGSSAEMLPSVISNEMSKLLGTQLDSPISMAASGNTNVNTQTVGAVSATFKGRNQQLYLPTGVKSLFPALSQNLTNARSIRDQYVDSLYSTLKATGTPAQKNYVDEHIVSGGRARQLGDQLVTALNTVDSDTEENVMKTAAALLALKVTPLVTLSINFGGDNHDDNAAKATEVTGHTNGITTINSLYDALVSYGIQDQTIFSMLNIFGRDTRFNTRGGRHHYGSHTVMFSFGPGIKGGMIGDVAQTGSNNFYQSMAINSVTGGTAGADIDANETHQSAAKSLIAATGVPEAKAETLVEGGKVVKAYLED